MDLSAPQFYALVAHGTKCDGPHQCHWCGAPCSEMWKHDDRNLGHYARPTTAVLPGSLYICAGCFFFRQKGVTINWLSGGFKDRQTPRDHSWIVTPDMACAVRLEAGGAEDRQKLYEILLKPPLKFTLAIVQGGENLMHRAKVIVTPEVNTAPLKFTVNNTEYTYTVYELERGLEMGNAQGLAPGVQVLMRVLGEYKGKLSAPPHVGRPTNEERDRRMPKKAPATNSSG